MQRSITEGLVGRLMSEYARDTGLDPPTASPRRYLWTDAFAVCNYLGAWRADRNPRQRELAIALIDQVHDVLGRHRPEGSRAGWISGLGDEEGERRPTAGGLRIGKPLDEREAGQPYDPRLEWERDGQYYHYLTKWMHALAQAGRVTGEPRYIDQAIELARSAHAAFTYSPLPGGRKRMYWKMSIDLSRPLVPSMGQHDPLDGYITFVELEAAAKAVQDHPREELVHEITELSMMCRGGNWETDDPLGIGGLLSDAARAAQLMRDGALTDPSLLGSTLRAAIIGLEAFSASGTLDLPAEHRLAFRELGLAIGLKGVSLVREALVSQPAHYGNDANIRMVQALMRYHPLAQRIEAFWSRPKSRAAGSWGEHKDINSVMLATALAPEGFLRF